jgi:hypothetical protein
MLVVAALVVGGAVGYVIASLTSSAAPPPAAPVPPTPPPVAAGPAPCADVAQRGSDLLAALDRAARAIADLDPAALRGTVDEIEQLRDELRADVQACRERTGAGGPAGQAPPG